MEQMRMKHNETGRSMVEMLGVLAVVGVLSIGGVAGYRYAVDKMNANEIINELKKRAITVSQQRVLGQTLSLAEYGDRALIKGTYSVSPISDYNGNASQFALEVAGVPERVCEMIIDSDWAMPTEKVVANGSCVDGGNTMTFAFNNTLGSGDTGNGGNESGAESTMTGTPEVSVSSEVSISPEVSVSDDQMSCESLKGVGNYEGGSGVCASCGDIRTLDKNGSCWLTTCPDGYMHDFVSFGTCIPCSQMDNATNSDFEDGGTMTQMFISECQACGGTYDIDHRDSRSGICSSNSVATQTQTETESETVTETETVSPEISESISNPEVSVSGGGQFCDVDGSCYSCSTSSRPYTKAEECAKCDDTSTPRVMSRGGHCALPCESGQFMNLDDGFCYSCSYSYPVSSIEDECAKCDGTSTPRTMYNEVCGLVSCPSGQFMTNDGSCYSCSYSSYVSNVTAEECAKCDGTSTPRFMSSDGRCYSCSDPDWAIYATAEGCAKCDGTSTPRFMSSDGRCFSCSYSSSASTTAEECAKCDDTSTPRVMSSGGYCALPCESGKVMSAYGNCALPCSSGQFMSSSGTCYSCSASSKYISATAEECAKCDDTSTPRYMSGSYCRLSS